MSVVDGHDRPGSQAALRSSNRLRVLQLLTEHGEITQAGLARGTGLAAATVSNIVRELLAGGLVQVSEVGRRKVVRLTRATGLLLGVDYGHRHLTVVVADRAHEILAERRVELEPNLPATEGVYQAEKLFGELLDEIGEQAAAIVGAGMGLPAPIDLRTGKVGAPSIMPGWVGVDAVRLASERLGMPVVVDNDANLGAVAELYWGAARGLSDIAYVKLSEGVGAGLVLGGQVVRGRDGTAGEIGHITTDEFGQVCRCGNRGCVETVVAARRVVELLEPMLGQQLTIADVVRSARDGNNSCVRVLADTGRQAGIAIANLCNVFNPELILIGGELAVAGEFLLAPMREMVRRCGIPSATADLPIILAELGPRAPVMGAVALALRASSPAELA
ncbi:MAG: ROK family transcriptional regulator [Pseudonocardia sp.]|nr:ROK family transcriptional regulator [Pseudonocardia sp.]